LALTAVDDQESFRFCQESQSILQNVIFNDMISISEQSYLHLIMKEVLNFGSWNLKTLRRPTKPIFEEARQRWFLPFNLDHSGGRGS
jgi:hypothetical protein